MTEKTGIVNVVTETGTDTENTVIVIDQTEVMGTETETERGSTEAPEIGIGGEGMIENDTSGTDMKVGIEMGVELDDEKMKGSLRNLWVLHHHKEGDMRMNSLQRL